MRTHKSLYTILETKQPIKTETWTTVDNDSKMLYIFKIMYTNLIKVYTDVRKWVNEYRYEVGRLWDCV